ncbi:adhesion G protein-coupled receptor L3-like [Clarias gariepinus]|uniref:adhesion G protein-coupled receptor L3-like n=1 Tax=Clarias gariepinus TaxID=13013 RepID=UPI00234C5B5A|nr:adhesion G protein-coupled receptor L3-like [Clarias gariepinus]
MTMNLMTYVTSTTTDQKVFVSVVVKPNPSSNNVSQLATTNASIDIDLIGISKNNRGSAAVAFMNYGNMADILKHSDTRKTIISSVVSATLPKTRSTWFTQPVNITFKHRELDTHGQLSCVYWNKNKWVEIGSTAIRHNSTHTICSYDDLSVFALIIEVEPCMTLFGVTVSLHCDSVLNMSVAQGFGVVFLALCLLTFAFCCQTRNNNTALINLCLNLLLFHLLDLLKPLFQLHLQSPEACAVTIGVRWFFFISTLVWMFIETVLLFLLVKKLWKMLGHSDLAQFIILGCYWIFPLIPSENEVLYNIFLFLNSQQGTFIFIVHCLLNQEVRQQYRKFLGKIFHFQNPGTTSEFRETQETQN